MKLKKTSLYFAQPRLRISNGRFYVDSGSAETVTELPLRLFQHFALDKNRRLIISAFVTARSIVISLVFISALSACGRVKEFFPDKQKDYQLKAEIPSLVIPPDLSNAAIKKTEVPAAAQPVFQEKDVFLADNKKEEVRKGGDAIYVDLVEYSGGATRIRIEDTLQRSWRTVGKALSRQSIEITDRNELQSIYFVQYDPDFKKVDDGSLWDEVLFLFGSDPAKEKEFRIKLAENGNLTEIIVLDVNDKPQSTGTALQLLELLYKNIKDDLAD